MVSSFYNTFKKYWIFLLFAFLVSVLGLSANPPTPNNDVIYTQVSHLNDHYESDVMIDIELDIFTPSLCVYDFDIYSSVIDKNVFIKIIPIRIDQSFICSDVVNLVNEVVEIGKLDKGDYTIHLNGTPSKKALVIL